jgi:2-keto-4-pentenoate hydratase
VTGLDSEKAKAAAEILWSRWLASGRIAALPEDCRPRSRAEGYAVQRAVAERAAEGAIGWKIAATSEAGQRHIAVSGPLAGRLLGRRVHFGNASFAFGRNIMRVAEAEFAFRMARDLPKKDEALTVAEVMAAVATAHPAIEIPDSRYEDFTKVGEAQLIADMACACWLAIGPPFPPLWRDLDLAAHAVTAFKNGAPAAHGTGKAVLGDPRLALTWIANELNLHRDGLKAGEYVTTGTCVVPVPIARGDAVRADYGPLGSLTVQIV